MAKLTLEDLTPLRLFVVVVEYSNSEPLQVLVTGHQSQVREGVLECFRIVNNNTCLVASFAPGAWLRVECAAPTHADFAVLEEKAILAQSEQQQLQHDHAVQEAIRLAAEETFSKMKH